ncbi:MarR family transcriptional regulator [Kribbella capetownensis]|uniref:MarR family transcriptional regulator n=1 Tax=Kribbella capetownensis TaxID=1572659 RepID=A0A4R0J0F9_9ACTN|nr:MarR family transcriptional regulator [Kribbella capetownensis]TCC37438.1 MarR family transcriptional regulator [Kribbella capetownensis]
MSDQVTATSARDRRDAAASAPVIEQASIALFEVTLGALSTSAQLSVLQIRMLLTLDQHGPLRLSDLAGQLDVSAPSASRIINRLADDGLVLRRTPDHDRRTVELRLSAKGRRGLARIRSARRGGIAEILALMTEDDRAALAAGLISFAHAAQLVHHPAKA